MLFFVFRQTFSRHGRVGRAQLCSSGSAKASVCQEARHRSSDYECPGEEVLLITCNKQKDSLGAATLYSPVTLSDLITCARRLLTSLSAGLLT